MEMDSTNSLNVILRLAISNAVITLSMYSPIDNIYWIDQANMKLVKIKWNEDPNNASKSTKSKVMK